MKIFNYLKKRNHSEIIVKKHPQIKLRVYEKLENGYLGSWYVASTLSNRFLYSNKIFKKNKAASEKAPFFVIGLFYNLHSICLSTGFWQGRFVWKCCVFDLGTASSN